MCDMQNFIEHLLVLCCIISFPVMSAILVSKKWANLFEDSAVGHGRKVGMTDYALCIEPDECELSSCLRYL